MTIDPDKYMVWKREDFDHLLVGLKNSLTPDVGEALNNFCSAELSGCTVFRDQDIFAGPALHAYVGQISTVLEVTHEMFPFISTISPSSPTLAHLEELREYFAQRADQADRTPSKIPD